MALKYLVIPSFLLWFAIFYYFQGKLTKRHQVTDAVEAVADEQTPAQAPGFRWAIIAPSAPIAFGAADMTLNWPGDRIILRCIGFVVVALGLWLTLHSSRILGDNFVGGLGINPAHSLVVEGPYHYVRNPIYSGILLSCLGLCVVSLNFPYGLGCLLFASVLLERIPHEEKLLRKEFGQAYDDYCSYTGRIIPRLRRRA